MGNDFNIEKIIEEYQDYVFKIVNNMVDTSLSYQDKEEIVSDVFYLLWVNRNNIKNNMKSYIGKITRNCTYDKIKRNKLDIEFKDYILPDRDFSKQIEYLDVINKKLEKLSGQDQEIFNLFYLKGYKIKEIAIILNLEKSTIKVKLHRIRKKLKEEL